jgi:class 3 adenylate cyclase/tetratricopeptide (TPR) repeat protein
MPFCNNCGKPNPEGSRFCSGCGEAFAPRSDRPAETRKTVTVVFCDLTGSTALGERLDSESLRRNMTRYNETMRGALERHGGTVEKFIGDAVVAAFGIPVRTEHDALRAVRAASDMREVLSELNEELEQRWGARLKTRTGINTGEVVAGDPSHGQSFIVGDAVNVAARLEQAAGPGEILLGKETHDLVRNAIRADAVEPLTLKGKSEPVPAFRLLEVASDVLETARRLDSPMVGREHELTVLLGSFASATEKRGCQLVVVMGQAGVGKSRLTRELVERVGDSARVLQGRCLPYGEGITYWPIAEVMKQAASIDDVHSREEAKARIAALLPEAEEKEAIVRGVAGALALSEGPSRPEETAWAIRKLFAVLADRSPLVLVFDDIHWAEQAFLDVIEHVATMSGDVPLLLLCIARPELRDIYPGFCETGEVAWLSLQPLEEAESAQLIEGMLGEARLASEFSRRIFEVAAGNPLFVEELLRMLVDDGLLERQNGRWRAVGELSEVDVPASIEALLGARLDRLEFSERGVMERAAVIGQEFWSGAVAELSPEAERPELTAHLVKLVGRELLRRGGPGFEGEDAFSFSHILVRDVAYGGLLKETRSELHERFADWLEHRVGERATEYEEIFGYHLEQAYRYREALGPLDEHGEQLAQRAAGRLSAAGRSAIARGDMPAAVKLLERATALLPKLDRGRVELLLDLVMALRENGDLERSDDVVEEAIEATAALQDRHLESRFVVERAFTHVELGRIDSAELIQIAERALPLFQKLEDELGIARAWHLAGEGHILASRWGPGGEAMERALLHAQRAGHKQQQELVYSWLGGLHGPTPATEAIERCEQILGQADGQRYVQAVMLYKLAGLHAMRGRFSEARQLYRRGKAITEESGQTFRVAVMTQFAGEMERLAGDLAAAERELRWGYEALSEMGEKAYLSSSAAQLADVVYAQGNYSEAERFTSVCQEAAAADDLDAQVRWRAMRAKLLARQGQFEQAEDLGREAVSLAGNTDELNLRGDAAMALAEVFRATGSSDEAATAIREALEFYEKKENLVSAQSARAILEELTSVPR